MREKENFEQSKVKREDERLEELKDKVKMSVKHLNDPIPVDYGTFARVAKLSGGYDWMTKKNRTVNSTVKCFGLGPRFELDENQKWKRKVEMWNKNATDKAIDPNKDATPGPQKYSLISTWSVKKHEDKGPKKKDFFNMVSTGPPKSMYYH